MSTAVIIALLAGGLFILVAIALTLQGIEKKQKEKRLLENALNARARNFQHLLDGFPQGFLSRDLQVLVCKCLLDTYEQLTKTIPGNSQYLKQKQLNDERLKQFKEKQATTSSISLSDLAQIREVQKLLTNLHKFIAKLMEAKRISPQEAQAYSQQVRQLLLQTTVDGMTQQLNEALKEGKYRLAIHHIKTVIDKLARENATGQYSNRIAAFRQQLSDIEQQAEQSDADFRARLDEADKEWEEINKPDDSWKKKALYD